MSEGGYIHHFPRVELRKDKTNPRRIAYVLLLLFATPPAITVMVVGTLLVLAGIAFHGWAAGYLARAGYEDRETVLTLLGPYRHNRNPYYVAHMVMDLGFFCLAGLAPFYLLYGPLMFLIYRRWVLNEEPFLRQEFGHEYDEMCREVPRWGVRLTPADARGPDQRFTWSMLFFNGEHWRGGAHLVWLAIFWALWVGGNPFAEVSQHVPATIGAIVAAHYLLLDVTPRDVSRVSLGWLAAAVALALGGATLLTTQPVWAVWPAPWSWLGRGAGIALGVILLTQLRGTHKSFVRAPIMPWHLGALALGLLSATFAGVWLALTATTTAWALSIAGVLKVPPGKPKTANGPQ